MYLNFFSDEFDALKERETQLNKDIKEAGVRCGEACAQGAETWHDNFELDDAKRVLEIASQKLKEVHNIISRAKVINVPDSNNGMVGMGKKVKLIMNETTTREVVIGGYQTNIPGRVGYNSPLIAPLMGLRVGEIEDVYINGVEYEVRILEIHLA